MEGSRYSGEAIGPVDELHAIKHEVVGRLLEAKDFGPGSMRAVESLPDETWQNLNDRLEDRDSLAAIDWTEPVPDPDTETTLQRLASIKAILPEDNEQEKKDKHNTTLENYIKFALEAAGDLSNLRVAGELVRAKLLKGQHDPLLAQQTFWIWAPAMEIAGWHGLRTELEEAAFSHLYPDEHQKIVDTYAHLGGDAALATMIGQYKGGMADILRAELEPDVDLAIQGRRKAYYSVWRKVTKDQRPYNLRDFLGMRVIVDSAKGETETLANCYAVAGLVAQCFTPEAGRYKDYIAQPKPNGYRSLHLGVIDINDARIEFQIRTAAMHDKAERDPNISHKQYDIQTKISPGRHPMSPVNPHRIYAWRERAATKINNRRLGGNTSLEQLEPGRRLVFADDGNLHQLAGGETALDFAFRVHSQRALSLQAIVSNGQAIRFDRPPKFGSVLSLRYDQAKRPTWDDQWLQKVNFSRAKEALRRARRVRDHLGLVAAGTALVENHKELRQPGVLSSLSPEQRATIAERYGIDDLDIVLRNIGARAEGFSGGKVRRQLRMLLGLAEAAQQERQRREQLPPTAYYRDEAGRNWQLAIGQMPGCGHHVAGCCQVKAGQPVVAVPCRITGDFSIHQDDCGNLDSKTERILPCEWQLAS